MASKQEQQEYREKRQARIADLKYYFGKDADEWIDLKTIVKDKALDFWRGKNPTEYPPYLCIECKRYWAYYLNGRKRKCYEYLSKKTFNRIRCDKIICKDCE
tara:strand:- start:1456 stop:1761 length:306 start_codon:yes stop_codon:yes gene_type:complete